LTPQQVATRRRMPGYAVSCILRSRD
jgi:hypothetical protein